MARSVIQWIKRRDDALAERGRVDGEVSDSMDGSIDEMTHKLKA